MIKRILIMVITAAVFQGCSTSKEEADIMIKNGFIYTVDENFSLAEAMVINEGRIVALGTEKELVAKYRPAEIIDAGGSFIYPGFYDPHCHFYHYGAGLITRADLRGTTSLDEIIQIIKEFAELHPGEWLAGRGWDHNNWIVKEFPDNKQLSSLFPNTPVMLVRVDGHAVLANDAALKEAGIDASTKIAGGEVVVKNGKLTGILLDNAADVIKEMFHKKAVSDLGEENLIKGILQAQNNCLAYGLTTVADAGLDLKEVLLLEKLQHQKRLKMNIYGMLNYTQENIGFYLVNGPYNRERMHLRSVKFYSDGAMGSYGALMLEPYSDKPGSYGILTQDTEEFRMNCLKVMDYGYQVITHAIGDSANRFVLGIYSSLLQPGNDLRWRIEHAQVVHSDDLEKFTRYNIIPAINAIHATSDMSWALDRLGPERIKYAYAYKKLLQTNGWLCNGSDFPIEPVNPLLGFYAAVARKDIFGVPVGGWQMGNALSRQEALMAMTIWSAKACFEEKVKGSLETGKFADFVILDKDIMKAPVNEVPKIKVTQTWIRGEKVFE